MSEPLDIDGHDDAPPAEKRGWTFDEAIQFVRGLETRLKDCCGCHFALGGSVLHSGESAKDLDIIVYPHWKPHNGGWDTTDVRLAISALLGYPLKSCTDKTSSAARGEPVYRDAKSVAWVRIKTGKHAGQRIDFFFLS